MKLTSLIAAVPLVVHLGCASTMSVTTTPPGADISVNGKPVGKSPVTTEVEGGNGPVQVKAKVGDKEVTKNVSRDGVNWGVVGAGAGAGVGTFCATWACSFGVGVLVPALNLVTIPIGCIGCASLVGAPVGAWFMWGGKPPDAVTIDLNEGGSAPMAPPPPPPPSAPPDATTEPMAPTTPTTPTPPTPPPEPLPY